MASLFSGKAVLSPFAQLEAFEVLLHSSFGVRCSSYAGGKALRLLYP